MKMVGRKLYGWCEDELAVIEQLFIKAIFEVLLGSGLRASECCALELGDIGIFHGKSQIDVRLGKGAKPRSVGIGPKLKAKLVAYLGATRFDEADKETPIFINRKGKQLTYSNLYDRIRKIRERSGVKCLHPHALRHAFGTHLYNYRMDLEYVREQLGHASIATTQIYAKTLTESKIEQMQGYEDSLDL